MLQARLLFGLLLFLGVTSQKDEDEGRPYEFGFTIDGEQHRYEKKDINGIVQGEFGFITGDGVYHVTVYATDENGSFKILSMKNIKVSEHQGGKPSTAGLVRQPIANQQPFGTAPQQPSSPLQQRPSPPSLPKPTSRPVYDFTTASTIRNGCSGCGIVTTPKTPFTFQNPAFQKPPSNGNSLGNGPPGGFVQKPFVPSGQSTTYPKPPAGTGVNQIAPPQTVLLAPAPPPSSGNNKPSERYPLGTQPVIPINQPGPISSNNRPVLPIGGNPPRPNTPLNQPVPVTSVNRPPGTTTSINQPNPPPSVTSIHPLTPINQPSLPRPSQNEIRQPPPPPSSAISQTKVENGMIKVPGNQPIPIKDKYPNMVNGLPNGITEKDISDLLYKFNYTLGFHGHYEKGLKNGTKIGGYFVNGRDGISRVVTYIADENGYRPKVSFINLGLNSEDTPKPDSEKKFGLKNFEFVWYPVKS